MPSPHPPLSGTALTDAISRSLARLYRRRHDHDRITARTYVKDDIVLCVLENLMTAEEAAHVAAGDGHEVIDGRLAFQTHMQDEFTAVIEELTGRRVVAFLSNNEAQPDLATELFFLEPVDGGG